MPEYNFEYNVTKYSQDPAIRISRYSIMLNSKAAQCLNNPKRINIGFDADNKVICIRQASLDKSIKSFSATPTKTGQIRINSKALINKISEITHIDYSLHSTRYTLDLVNGYLLLKL